MSTIAVLATALPLPAARQRLLPLLAVPALGQLLEHLRAEGGEVVRLAARREPGVDVDLLVDPGRAGVPQVRPEARPRRDRAPAHDVRLDEGPRPVADRRDRLALLDEGAGERDRVLV